MNEFLAGAGTDAPDVEEENIVSRPSISYDDMRAKTLLETTEMEVGNPNLLHGLRIHLKFVCGNSKFVISCFISTGRREVIWVFFPRFVRICGDIYIISLWRNELSIIVQFQAIHLWNFTVHGMQINALKNVWLLNGNGYNRSCGINI